MDYLTDTFYDLMDAAADAWHGFWDGDWDLGLVMLLLVGQAVFWAWYWGDLALLF